MTGVPGEIPARSGIGRLSVSSALVPGAETTQTRPTSERESEIDPDGLPLLRPLIKVVEFKPHWNPAVMGRSPAHASLTSLTSR